MSRPVRTVTPQSAPDSTLLRPLLPAGEVERLKALEDYEILDTLPEQDFDDITYIASQICGTPISLVSLVDERRQWFKSHYGLDLQETARELSFCGYAINNPSQPFIVKDAHEDARFKANPLVTGNPNITFYAGVPLVNPEGHPLGTLCVIDQKPRELTAEQMKALEALARMVMRHLEERRTVRELNAAQTELLAAYKELDQFSYVIAHDLKSPLNNIISLADLIRTTEDNNTLGQETTEFLDLISVASRRLASMIDAVLKFTRQNHVMESTKEVVVWCDFVNEVLMLLKKPEQVEVTCLSNTEKVRIHKSPMQQILINLCSNALRFIDREGGQLVVEMREERGSYRIAVTDNGPGIPEGHRDSIFNLFQTLKATEATGEGHFGIGLATVRKLVTRLGGTINLISHVGVGTSFIIVLPKL